MSTEATTTLNPGSGGDSIRGKQVELKDGSLVRQQVVTLAESDGDMPEPVTGMLGQILEELKAIHFLLEITTDA